MRKKMLASIFGLAVVLTAASPAWAARRSFTVDPWSAVISGNAARNIEGGNDGGLELAGSGSSVFGFGFQIPKNYKTNSPIRVIFRWHTFATNCDLDIIPTVVGRARVGVEVPNFDMTGDMQPMDGSGVWTAAATSDLGIEKAYLLNQNASFAQRGGDDILLAFERVASDVSDTCASEMFITGITVSYVTR